MAPTDAHCALSRSKHWEPIDMEWRGGTTPRIARPDRIEDGHTVIKSEHLPDGRRKMILKDSRTGEIVDRIV